MKYLPLFNLQLIHPYYADGRCTDFEIRPTLDTQQGLKNYRCVLRPTPNGMQVFMAVTDKGWPFIAVNQRLTFKFQLYLQNPNFPLFTNINTYETLQTPLYTTNSPKGRTRKQLRLISQQTQNEGQSITSEAVYPRPPIDGNFFADLEIQTAQIRVNRSIKPQDFQINFKTKQVRWIYYLVTERNGNNGSAKFEVHGSEIETVFNSEVLPDETSDIIAQGLANRFPDTQRIRFISDALIPCQQQARKAIQLTLNGDPVLNNLSNPSLRNHTNLVVNQNSPSQTDLALYHIINYLPLQR